MIIYLVWCKLHMSLCVWNESYQEKMQHIRARGYDGSPRLNHVSILKKTAFIAHLILFIWVRLDINIESSYSDTNVQLSDINDYAIDTTIRCPAYNFFLENM